MPKLKKLARKLKNAVKGSGNASEENYLKGVTEKDIMRQDPHGVVGASHKTGNTRGMPTAERRRELQNLKPKEETLGDAALQDDGDTNHQP